MTSTLQNSITEACDFAWKSHTGQFRKCGTIPYIYHPLAVLARLSEWGVIDIDLLKAAPCHDVREDCGVSSKELAGVIGSNSTSMVEEVSFFPDPDDGRPNHIQKQDFMKSFFTKSIGSVVLKVADRVENTMDFLTGDNHDYAPKYWAKAEPLMSAMTSRREEIEKTFGESVFLRMQYTRSTLAPMLVR